MVLTLVSFVPVRLRTIYGGRIFALKTSGQHSQAQPITKWSMLLFLKSRSYRRSRPSSRMRKERTRVISAKGGRHPHTLAAINASSGKRDICVPESGGLIPACRLALKVSIASQALTAACDPPHRGLRLHWLRLHLMHSCTRATTDREAATCANVSL